MLDHDAIQEAQRRWDRGWAFLPKSGWRKVEGGVFHPSENRFGEVFAAPPEDPPTVRHAQYMYEVGRFETDSKRTKFVVLGRGMTWEEAFAAVQ